MLVRLRAHQDGPAARRDPSADPSLRTRVIGRHRRDPSDPSGKDDAGVVSAATAEGGPRASTDPVPSGAGKGGPITACRTTPPGPSGKGAETAASATVEAAARPSGRAGPGHRPRAAVRARFTRRFGGEASHCPRAMGAAPQKLRRTRHRTGGLRAVRPARTLGCTSGLSRNARRLLLGAAGGGWTLRGKAGRMQDRPRTDRHRLQWYRTKPSGEVRDAVLAPCSLESSIPGWILSKEAYPLLDNGSEDLGHRDWKKAEAPTPVGACGCKARHGIGFGQSRITAGDCDRRNDRPRTDLEAIAPAAEKTSIFGCRRDQSHPRLLKPALSGTGGSDRNCGKRSRRPRTKAEQAAPAATRPSVFGQRAR